MWLNKFKIALVQKDGDTINKLLDEVPNFEDVEDATQALHLFKEAVDLLNILKTETSESMKQVKQNINFLNSASHNDSNKLDVIS